MTVGKSSMIPRRTDIENPQVVAILGGDAVDFYGLDVEKLAPIAARIGPEKGIFQETSA